jgi:hypothetical protein
MYFMGIKIKDMNRFKIFCFCTVLITFFILQVKSIYSYNYPAIKSVVVVEGETLWDIASHNKTQGEDTRRYLEKIKELNKISSDNLIEGQEIKVPVLASN